MDNDKSRQMERPRSRERGLKLTSACGDSEKDPDMEDTSKDEEEKLEKRMQKRAWLRQTQKKRDMQDNENKKEREWAGREDGEGRRQAAG